MHSPSIGPILPVYTSELCQIWCPSLGSHVLCRFTLMITVCLTEEGVLSGPIVSH